MSRGHERDRARLYVGNLPDDVRERELEELFSKYGRIRDIDLKTGRTSNGTAFAFVEFDNVGQAEDAIDGRDGCRFGNLRLKVEFSGERGTRRGGAGGFRRGPPKRTDYRVTITGLPTSASWQDLKDHMRQAGPVGYADAKEGKGIVEYETEKDMLYAVNTLDKSEFRNPFTRSVIRVRPESENYKVNRSYSRSRSRSSHYQRTRRSGSRASSRGRTSDRESERKSRSASPVNEDVPAFRTTPDRLDSHDAPSGEDVPTLNNNDHTHNNSDWE